MQPCIGASKRKQSSFMYKQQHGLTLEFRPYVCNYIKKIENLKKQKFRVSLKPYRCGICKACFISGKGLLYHFYQHYVYKDTILKNAREENMSGIKCKKCGCVFISLYMLQFHMESVDCRNVKIVDTKPFTCHICKKAFQFLCLLEKHLTTGHSTINCISCSLLFLDFPTYKIHKESMCGAQDVYNFWSSHYKQENWKNKNVGKQNNNHGCSQCKISFKTLQEFEKHEQMHSSPPVWKCYECDGTFLNSTSYKKHFITLHGSEKNPFQCRHCKKEFVKPECWRIHEKEHFTPKTVFKCDICEKTFSKKGLLAQHKLCHSSDRPWKCTQCDKTFKLKGDMKKHLVVHTGLKPYVCSMCNMGFARSSYLSRHVRTHSAVKPFVCEFCQKGFFRSEHYREHRRIHTGERPYVCHCGASFKDSGNFYTHKKTHDPTHVGRRRKRKQHLTTATATTGASIKSTGTEPNIVFIASPLLETILTPSQNDTVLQIISSSADTDNNNASTANASGSSNNSINNYKAGEDNNATTTFTSSQMSGMECMSLEDLIAQATDVNNTSFFQSDDNSKLLLAIADDQHLLQPNSSTTPEQLVEPHPDDVVCVMVDGVVDNNQFIAMDDTQLASCSL